MYYYFHVCSNEYYCLLKKKFMWVRCYLIFHIETYFLCIILNYKNLKFKHLINNIIIDLWSFENFVSMEDIRRKCNLMMDLSKFTSNKKILNEVVVLDYNQVCSLILSLSKPEIIIQLFKLYNINPFRNMQIAFYEEGKYFHNYNKWRRNCVVLGHSNQIAWSLEIGLC